MRLINLLLLQFQVKSNRNQNKLQIAAGKLF